EDMKHSLLAAVVTLLATFTVSSASASDPASVVRGGRLYDNWSAETKSRTPNHPNPAFKAKQARVAPADTWRCVECHGWDYKGNQGQYGSGTHATGIKGVRALAGTDPGKIMVTLQSSSHLFGAVLKHRDLQDLANFVSYGQIDMDSMIDARTGLSRGDTTRGAAHYRSMCAGCHGLEGRFVAKRHMGRVAREDPWHAAHNMLNGHPDDTMPALREIDPKAISDILAHMQTLQERR
ncbi:c-type cytochrome, partial [Rhodoferax sp.]|uniref:c-type cytochrome n=1 Tax=Rhodoferax sp. TaxID=50421 RepID=UPI0027161CE7